jgi:hypothetical protein
VGLPGTNALAFLSGVSVTKKKIFMTLTTGITQTIMCHPGGEKFCALYSCNEGNSAASFCHQGAAWVSDMFCNFYLVKYYNIANNLAATEAREKISTYLESLVVHV